MKDFYEPLEVDYYEEEIVIDYPTKIKPIEVD